MDVHALKLNTLACTSIGACAAGFVTASIPYLQFAALVISIIAGIRAFVESRKAVK